MLRAVRWFNLRRAVRHPLRTGLAALAVGAGVSLAVSVLIVSGSIARSAEQVGVALGGVADLRVVGATARGGLEADVLTVVATTEGVQTAVPMVQAVAQAGTADAAVQQPTLVLGVDCGARALAGAIACRGPGSPPVTSGRLVRDLPDGSVLRTNAGSIALSAFETSAVLDVVNGGGVVVMELTDAQRRFDRLDRLDAIYVIADEGADLTALRDRLEVAVGPHNGVLAADAPPPGSELIVTQVLSIFTLLSLFALGVGAVLIHNTVTLSMEERRRELAVVGALGGTGRVIVGGAMLEGAAVGMAGGALGALGGWALAGPVVDTFDEFSRRFTGFGVEPHAAVSTVAVAIALGAVVAALATIVPARRAARLDVAAELSQRGRRDEDAPPARIRRALVLGAIGLAGLGLTVLAHRDGSLESWQPAVGYVGLAVLLAAFLPMSGVLAGLMLRALTPLTAHRSAPLRLGIAGLVRDPRRTGVLAVAVSSAVGTALVVASFTASIVDAVEEGTTIGAAGRVWVSTLPVDGSAAIDSKPTPETIAAIAEVPGVARVDRAAFLLTGTGSGDLVCVSSGESPTMEYATYRGSNDVAAFEEGRAMIGATLARARGLDVGDRLRLDTPRGVTTVEVQGIWADGDCTGASVSLPWTLMQDLYGPEPASGLWVVPDGVSAEVAAERIENAEIDPALTAQTVDAFVSEFAESLEDQMALFWVMQRGLLVVAVVAVLSSFLLVGVQRQREFGLLGALGMPPRQLALMVLGEALLVGVVGSVMGLVVGVAFFEGFRELSPILFGWPDPFVLDVATGVQAGVVATVAAIAAAALPAWRAGRIEIVEALHYE